MIGAVKCRRAAEVVEALAERKGTTPLDPETRAKLIGGIATLTLQTQELLMCGLMPKQAAAHMFAKCVSLLDVLGLDAEEKRAVFQAAANDLKEASR